MMAIPLSRHDGATPLTLAAKGIWHDTFVDTIGSCQMMRQISVCTKHVRRLLVHRRDGGAPFCTVAHCGAMRRYRRRWDQTRLPGAKVNSRDVRLTDDQLLSEFGGHVDTERARGIKFALCHDTIMNLPGAHASRRQIQRDTAALNRHDEIR